MPTEAELLAARQAGYLTPAGQNLIRDGDDAISQNAVTAHKAVAEGIKAARWLKGGIPLDADLNEYKTEGAYGINTYTIAESLKNRPTLVAAVDRATFEVLPNGSGGGVQRWTTTKGATAPDSPRLQRRWDNTGAWTDWERTDRDPTTHVPAARAATAAHQAEDGMVALLAGLTGDPDAPWLWRGTTGVKLTTPTHEGSGQACHPSVLYFPAGRFGWRYWMAMTPYPGAQEAHEDPNVLVSNDGNTWQVPSGLTNPLDDQPGRPGAHNSDTHMVELPDGRLMLSWRTVDRPNGNRNILCHRVTSDGVMWTPKAEMLTLPATGPHSTFLSQSVVRVGDRWRIYGITTQDTNQLCYIETTQAVPAGVAWTAPTVCTVRGVAADREMWHSDVQYVGGQWWAIVNDGLYGTSAADGDLHLARSADGITWDYSPTPLVPRVGTDHDTLYKAGFVVGSSGELDIFYSAYTMAQRWHIFRTKALKAAPAGELDIDATAAYQAYMAERGA